MLYILEVLFQTFLPDIGHMIIIEKFIYEVEDFSFLLSCYSYSNSNISYDKIEVCLLTGILTRSFLVCLLLLVDKSSKFMDVCKIKSWKPYFLWYCFTDPGLVLINPAL